jgi:hypothetical protein
MLRQPIDLCPENVWTSREHTNAFWQIAYHTLFFAHLYLQPNEGAFRLWKGHPGNVQYADGIAEPADPNSALPLLPRPYTKDEVFDYWNLCDEMVNRAVEALDILAPESGFSWYKVSKLEHQLINVRHIQHGAAQLADRLRSATGTGTDWVGARRG